MITPPLLSKAALDQAKLDFAHDEFHARDAEADDALHEVAEFAACAKLWEKPSIEVLADLNMRAYEAESRRRHARMKLLWEMCAVIRAEAESPDVRTESEEGSAPW